MKITDIGRSGKVVAFFLLFVVCCPAQGMLEELKKESVKFFMDNKDPVITGVTSAATGFGAFGLCKIVEKLFFSKKNDNVMEETFSGPPPPPPLDPSFLQKKKKKPVGVLEVPELKVRKLLDIKKGQIPKNEKKVIKKKGGTQPSVSKDELVLKQYKMVLKNYLGNLPQPANLIEELEKKFKEKFKN